MPGTAKPRFFVSRWAPACLSALLAAGLYAITLGGTYIYDDVPVVQIDPRLHDPHQWKQLWTGQYFTGANDNLYRPLISQSYALQWWLHDDKPWVFHLVNILLHAGVAALVAELAIRLAGWRTGLIAGLLFASHPAHVEAVAEIVGRADLASTAALLGALILFLHRPMTTPRAIAIGSLGIIAMLCKESGMLLPGLLLMLAFCRRMATGASAETKDQNQRRSTQWLIVIVAWSTAGFILIREQILHLRFEWDPKFLDWTIQPMINSHGIDRIALPLLILGRYMRLIFWPSFLSIDYGDAVIKSHAAWPDGYIFTGIATLAVWLILFLLSLKKRWWAAAFCLLATAFTYAMISNVILIGTVFGERLIYLPSVFILIFLAIGIAPLGRGIVAVILIAALSLASLRTVTYAASWNNKGLFYQTSLAKQPQSVRLHLLMAYRYYELGKYADAQKVMDDAMEVEPAYWQNWLFSAQIEEKRGDWPLALKYAQRASEIDYNVMSQSVLSDARVGAAAATQPAH